ncbi:hypothetical protein F2Q69_00049318 [Brassica cretica]|uniref:Uncharacterized protein n=1 Tax=Brassica cretica TaxID=69181 RepID=A0A8S9PTT3_BRACR|nr:hypothetical protein F2Q69_00049318 [Brassica cretica]
MSLTIESIPSLPRLISPRYGCWKVRRKLRGNLCYTADTKRVSEIDMHCDHYCTTAVMNLGTAATEEYGALIA